MMNLVKAVVVEVLTEPEKNHGKWWIEVKANSYGHISNTFISFDTKEEAEQVEEGYEFLT